MPRAHRLNEHFAEDESSTADHGLFHLPSLPPWKTPKLKGHYQSTTRQNCATPLNGTASLLVYHSHEGQEAQNDSRDSGFTNDILNIKVPRDCNDLEYDYQALSQKPLISESKVREFLQSERAAHCLVFHKKAHVDDTLSYRPDLEWECSDYDDEPDINDNGSLLQAVPGCSSEDVNFLLNKNFMSQRPNVRKYDEILSRKVNGIKRFWGDSDLTSTLSRKHIHEQFRHLTDEHFVIATMKLQLKKLHSEAPKVGETLSPTPAPDNANT